MAAYCASKAGVEQFGNALRLEVAHHGVTVGTAHPAWIDIDLVRDKQQDSEVFRRALDTIPGPLGSVTPVDVCARAFVDGIERRRRRVYVPRSLAVVQALRTLFVGPVADLYLRRAARAEIPGLEAEVRALGRSFGRTSAAADPGGG